jgi:hypothetical protein
MADDDGGGEAPGGKEEGGKPDFLPEKFWNPDTKAADLEGLSNSYNEMGTKIREKTDDVRNTILAEQKADLEGRRPETSNDYEVKVPDKIASEMGEGMSFEFSDQDPMMTFWKDFSWEHGFNQEQFEEGISAYITGKFADLPNFETELGKLGENGRDRSQHVNLWAQKQLSPETYKALESFAVTADGVMALEEIMRVSGEPAFSPGGPAGVGSQITLKELRQMQADPRYWDPNQIDSEFIKKVDAGYEKLVS